MKNNMLKIILKIILLIFLLILLLIGLVLIIRIFSLRQLDDFSSQIPCENSLIEKSEILMVIPLFNNVSIASNKSWCNWVLSLNKTLVMHGVYHPYLEFAESRDENYIRIGMEEFNKCFGYSPKVFEAPQLVLSKENGRLLKSMGFEIKGWPNTILRKVYHCQDTGMFAMGFWKIKITNKLIDRI